MKISMDYEDIYGASMKNMWDFCFRHCNKVTLTNSFTPKYTLEEYNMAKEKRRYDDDLNYESWMNRAPLSPEEQENSELNIEMLKQLEIENLSQGLCSKHEINEFLYTIKKNFIICEREVSYENHCTSSSRIMVNCTFEINDALKQCFYKMDNLFTYVELIDDFSMDDPVFYKDNKKFLSICTHEQFATLDISEEEYEEFSLLQIPHLGSKKMWWHEENNMKYDYFPSMIPQRGCICGLDGYEEPIMLGLFGVHEENEQIYIIYKEKLSPNLIPFDEILEKINKRYTLIPIKADELRERTEQNVLCNTCLARHLPESKEMRIEIFLVIEDEKSAQLYEQQEAEYRFYTARMTDMNPDYITEEFIKNPIILGYEYYSNYLWVEGSYKLRDELTLIRGLCEVEIRDKQLLSNYVKALMNSTKV